MPPVDRHSRRARLDPVPVQSGQEESLACDGGHRYESDAKPLADASFDDHLSAGSMNTTSTKEGFSIGAPEHRQLQEECAEQDPVVLWDVEYDVCTTTAM